jgi:hypothetical protein
MLSLMLCDKSQKNLYAKCRYAECCYAECRGASTEKLLLPTFSWRIWVPWLKTNDTKHNDTQYYKNCYSDCFNVAHHAEWRYAVCRYAKCHRLECCGAFNSDVKVVFWCKLLFSDCHPGEALRSKAWKREKSIRHPCYKINKSL